MGKIYQKDIQKIPGAKFPEVKITIDGKSQVLKGVKLKKHIMESNLICW